MAPNPERMDQTSPIGLGIVSISLLISVRPILRAVLFGFGRRNCGGVSSGFDGVYMPASAAVQQSQL